jgi:hypothetical protein
MGNYIMPTNMTAEQFLIRHGNEMTVAEFLRTTYTEQSIQQRMNVVLENGPQKTAVILNDDLEHQRMKSSIPLDSKSRKYYSVPIPMLEPYL